MFVLDTNIIIGYLAGDEAVTTFVDEARSRKDLLMVSVITEIELFASPAMEPGDEILVDRLLATLDVVGLYSTIARRVAALRREFGIALGDAVIAATAQSRHATLVTRDRQLTRKAKAQGIAVTSV